MKFSKVNFVQDINRPPEDPTPSSKENQKKQSGTNNMITTNNIALSGEKNILFIILIFCRLKTLLQKMEGNPNLSCSGPPSLIGPACFLRQIPKQLEKQTNAPSVVPWLAERARPLVPWLPIKPVPADIEPDTSAQSGDVRRDHIPPVQLWLGAGWQNLAAFRRGQKWPWKFSSDAFL